MRSSFRRPSGLILLLEQPKKRKLHQSMRGKWCRARGFHPQPLRSKQSGQGPVGSGAVRHHLFSGASRQTTAPSLRNPISTWRTVVGEGPGVIRSSVSVCPITKYPPHFVVAGSAPELEVLCWAERVSRASQPKLTSAMARPAGFDNLVFMLGSKWPQPR
jgi:hypothetical protein